MVGRGWLLLPKNPTPHPVLKASNYQYLSYTRFSPFRCLCIVSSEPNNHSKVIRIYLVVVLIQMPVMLVT